MTDPKNDSQKSSDRDLGSKEAGSKTPWIVLAIPLLLVIVILFLSPNFQSDPGMRIGPMGGDFLQEWIGATMFNQGMEEQLYDLPFVQRLQHDVELVGFLWPEEDYFPMVYPPFYYAALRPLSGFSYPVASKVWAICSAFAFSLSGWLLYRFYPPCQRVFGICFVSALIFVPLLSCFTMGQKSTFLLLILSGSFVLMRHGKPFLAGLVFGLIVFKPHLGIVIGLTMLLKRQWKFALGALAVVGCALGYSWFNHRQLLRDYIDLVTGMGDYIQTGGYQLADSHSLWGATQLTFGWLPGYAVNFLTGVFSVAVVVLLWRIMRGRFQSDSPGFARQYAAMILATVMLSPHFYGYDLTLLLLPMILLVSSCPPGQWKSVPIELCLGLVLLAMFVLAGLFQQIAQVTHVQLSVLLMTAALVLVGLRRPVDDAQLRSSSEG